MAAPSSASRVAQVDDFVVSLPPHERTLLLARLLGRAAPAHGPFLVMVLSSLVAPHTAALAAPTIRANDPGESRCFSNYWLALID